MELRFKNILMMLVPTTILSFSYFWWKQKMLKYNSLKASDETTEKAVETDIKPTPKADNMNKESDENKVSDTDQITFDDVLTLTDLLLPKENNKSIMESKSLAGVENADPVVTEELCTVKEQQINFVENDTFDDTFTMQDFNHSSKRKRQYSSCDGDSAFVEDFSSDNVSISGSDTNSNKTPTTPEHPVCEDLISPEESENYEAAAPNNNFRDWFGPALEPTENPNSFVDILNWGSQPASDLEGEIDEVNPIKHEVIAGVAIEKLSIVLEKEYMEHKERSSKSKKTEKPAHSKKSPRTPKKSPRSPKKKSNMESPKQSKSPKTKKTSKRKEERDLDKPWREQNETPKTTQNDPSEYEPIYPNDYAVLEYLIPEDLCGKVIGKHGKAVKDINEKTGAYICIESEKIECKCVLSISGLYSQAQDAEKILLTKFRNSMKRYVAEWPSSTSVESISIPFSEYIDIITTAVINAGNVWLQIFDSEVNNNLVQLQNEINKTYSVPPQRVMYHKSRKPKVNEVCISFIDNIWCRVKVHEYLDDNDVVVVFIDYGGNVIVPWHMLFRAMKEFLKLPAQAVSCYMANSYPLPDQVDYSYSANLTLNQLVEGKVLKAYVHGTDNDIPCVELFYTKEETNEEISINSNLINWGLVSPYVSYTVPENVVEISELEEAQIQSFESSEANIVQNAV